MPPNDEARTLAPMKRALLGGAVLVLGACGGSSLNGSDCEVGYTLCGLSQGEVASGGSSPTCANLATDRQNCAACGHACSDGEACVDSVCRATGTGGGPGAPAADGAWFVSIVSDTPACALADFMVETGQVDGTSKQQVVVDGKMSATIACTVMSNPDGSFAVQAQGSDATATGSTLEIEIPRITSGATMANPATGTVFFISPQTADNEFASNACNFYFTSKDEGVAVGQVWVTFDCPMLSHPSTGQTCDLSQGFAIFENCATM